MKTEGHQDCELHTHIYIRILCGVGIGYFFMDTWDWPAVWSRTASSRTQWEDSFRRFVPPPTTSSTVFDVWLP